MESFRAAARRFPGELWSVYRSVTYSDLIVRGMLSLHLIFIIACVQEKRKAVCTRASLLKLPMMTSVFAVVFRPLRELLALMQPLYLRTHAASQPYFDDDRVMVALWVVPNIVLTLVFLLVVAFHRDRIPLPSLLSGEGATSDATSDVAAAASGVAESAKPREQMEQATPAEPTTE